MFSMNQCGHFLAEDFFQSGIISLAHIYIIYLC